MVAEVLIAETEILFRISVPLLEIIVNTTLFFAYMLYMIIHTAKLELHLLYMRVIQCQLVLQSMVVLMSFWIYFGKYVPLHLYFAKNSNKNNSKTTLRTYYTRLISIIVPIARTVVKTNSNCSVHVWLACGIFVISIYQKHMQVLYHSILLVTINI